MIFVKFEGALRAFIRLLCRAVSRWIQSHVAAIISRELIMNTEMNAADISLSFCDSWASEVRQRMAVKIPKTIFRRFCVTIA
jgi:hypothetical protein